MGVVQVGGAVRHGRRRECRLFLAHAQLADRALVAQATGDVARAVVAVHQEDVVVAIGEFHRRQVGHAALHRQVAQRIGRVHVGQRDLLAPQRGLGIAAAFESQQQDVLALGALGFDVAALRRRGHVERMAATHRPQQFDAEAQHPDQEIRTQLHRQRDRQHRHRIARLRGGIRLERDRQQHREEGDDHELHAQHRHAGGLCIHEQVRQQERGERIAAVADHRVRACKVAGYRDQPRRQWQHPVAQVDHARGHRVLVEADQRDGNRNRGEQQHDAGAAQRTGDAQPMQRAMQQAEPLVRLAIAAHLVQAQQGAGQRIHRGEYLVDEDGLLGHVHHAAEEAQHHEVGDEGHDGPQAEAQQLALEEIDHGYVLVSRAQAAAGAAWFLARKALTARSRLTGIDCTLRAPDSRRKRSKPSSWSSTR